MAHNSSRSTPVLSSMDAFMVFFQWPWLPWFVYVRFMRFLVALYALLVGCSSPVCHISFLASRCYIMWIHVMWRHVAWVISRQSWTSPDQKGTDLIAGKHETPRPRCDSVLKCPKKALWWVPKSLDMHHFRNRNHPKDPQRFSRLICLRNMRAFFIRCFTHHQLRHCWLKMLRMGFVDRLLKTSAGCSLWMAGRV